jgi:hypothetical protein
MAASVAIYINCNERASHHPPAPCHVDKHTTGDEFLWWTITSTSPQMGSPICAIFELRNKPPETVMARRRLEQSNPVLEVTSSAPCADEGARPRALSVVGASGRPSVPT